MTTDIEQTELKAKKQPKRKIISILRTIMLYGLMFVVIYSVVNWWRQPIMPANPQLQLTDYQGQTIDLAAMSHERPTLVYFWGTWCSVCSFTSPTITKLAADNYPVVTVAVQSGSNQELRSYLDQHRFDFTTINDQQGNKDGFNIWISFPTLRSGLMPGIDAWVWCPCLMPGFDAWIWCLVIMIGRSRSITMYRIISAPCSGSRTQV